MFISDKPINSLNDDRLNRKSFSRQLAQAILLYSNQDNFTIGLCGKWGTGKTSIINMVIEEITNLTREDENKPIIVKFNPWNYSDKTHLISQFFQTIMLEIGAKSSSESLKNVGSVLQKYSSVVTYAEYIPIVGKYLQPVKELIGSTGKSLVELAESRESLENLKEEVIEALRQQEQKILVIIDDIDRLNNEQIRLIFQLVNCVAGFPNMIYLLSFDKSVVVRALEEEQKCNGEEYLEKIIQVPFDVPVAKESDVQRLFFDQLDSLWFGEMPCEYFDNDYWSTVFNDCLAPFLNTVRDVNRIINVYRFKYGLLHSETNCIDLLAITTLQVCAPEMFDWVKDNISKLTGSCYSVGISHINQNKYKEEILEEFKGITDNAQIMLQALQAIFPKFSWNTGGYSTGGETEDELRRKQKISCSDRTPLYFRLSLEDVSVPQRLIVDSINTYDSAELDGMLNDLVEKGFISQYVKDLNARANTIPENRKKLILQKLIHLQTMSFENEGEGFLQISPTAYCNHCCWTILKTMKVENIYTVLKDLIDSSDNNQINILADMIVQIERSFGRIGDSPNHDFRVISEEQLISLEALILVRIKEISKSCFLFKSKSAWTKYWFWKYKEPESLRNHVNSGLNNKNNIPYYLFACASIWTGGKTHGWEFEKESVEEFIPIDKAYKDLISLKNTEGFSNLEFDVKETTVAFYLWYNSDREKHDSISKENVDAIIPEWEKLN